MRWATGMLAAVIISLAGCATEAVYLRHPETGQTVKCGPYSYVGNPGKSLAIEQERGCINDYQRQGYQRVPEEP